MKLDKNKTAFGRHETFPLRYGWLTKGVSAINDNEKIFSQPEKAMTELGLGKNMVNALQYWLQAAGLASFDSGVGAVSALGNALLGDEGDPYLEDEATIWVTHWLIASNAELATGFFWFFNYYSPARFRDTDALNALEEFVVHDIGIKRAHATLKSDFSTLLRMYSPVAGRGGEDHLDSPLASLQLVTPDESHGYNSMRTIRPFLPPVAMHFALQRCFEHQARGQISNGVAAIPVRELLYGGTGNAAPGSIFRLTEEGFMASLNSVIDEYPSYYEINETAGLNQLYCLRTVNHSGHVLSDYYEGQRDE